MKTLVIDAIVGIDFPSVLLFDEVQLLIKAGLAEFTGKQWNEKYEWRRDQLEKIELEKLQELYTALREAREEAQSLSLIQTNHSSS